MQILQSSTTPTSTILPITGVDASIHKFVGVSWRILIPYTIVGIGLMIYCQIRLLRGQRELNLMKLKHPKVSLYTKIKNKLGTPRLILEYIK